MALSSPVRWWPLPKRDIVLLPLIALATLALMLVPAELILRRTHASELEDSCIVETKTMVYHGRPRCVSRTKAAEGPWVTNKYNECGYRTPEPCGPKPAGSLRIAVIGSSTSAGYLTPYAYTLAARGARALTKRCGRPVEFQNLGAPGNVERRLVASASEAMRLGPDALVLVVTPFDFEPSGGGGIGAAKDPAKPNWLRQARQRVSASSLLYMESYLLLRDDASYVPFYLALGRGADFMRAPMPEGWQRRVESFDEAMASIDIIAKRRSVPTLLLYIPQRAQASLIASQQKNPDFHPDILPRALQNIANNYGIGFVDITRKIAPHTPSSHIFYPINGHINAQGHALAAAAMTQYLTSSKMLAFARKCKSSQLH